EVRRPVVEDAPLRMADAAHGLVPRRLRHPPRELLAALTLARMDAGLHPVELREHVVGQVERAVAEDVALRAAQDPERRELLVRGCDLLALAAYVVRVEPRHDADRSGVVA